MILPSPSTDLDPSSAFHVEARMAKEITVWGEFRKHSLRSTYDNFRLEHQTLSSLRILNTFISVVSAFVTAFSIIPFLFIRAVPHSRGPLVAIAVICFLVALNFYSWYGYASFSSSLGVTTLEVRKSVRSFQVKVTGIFLAVLVALHIVQTVEGQCRKHSLWGCNEAHENGVIPPDTMILIAALPAVHAVAVGGNQHWGSVGLWVVSTSTLTFSSIFLAAHQVLLVLYCAFSSAIVIVISRRHSHFLFFAWLGALSIVEVKQRAVDEANASELRHMIANVAHDLKTPLASFLGGIDYIAHEVSELGAQPAIDFIQTQAFVRSIGSCVTNMRNTNSFMLMTINRCIDYTKASKGVKLVPKYETVDLQEALALPLNCMKDIQQRIPIVLVPLAGDICSHVITDKQWLQENVLCLLSNAIKYSNEGSVTVSVMPIDPSSSDLIPGSHKSFQSSPSRAFSRSVELESFRTSPKMANARVAAETAIQGTLRVEVEDHGIGLSEEAMAALFSPFKQAQRLAGGTGLGLFSMAKRLEALEGTCGVQQRRDGAEGSLFWFEIPYRPDEQAAAMMPMRSRHSSRCRSFRPSSSLVAASTDTAVLMHPSVAEAVSSARDALVVPPPSGMMSILVVDDSPAILKMTTMMLKKHKHEVCTATNGAEALKIVCQRLSTASRGFDVILMDLQMPVMDGLEATMRLRAMMSSFVVRGAEANVVRDCHSTISMTRVHPRLVVIGVSANSDSETAAAAFKAGVDAFIAKPFSLEVFYNTVDALGGNDGPCVGMLRLPSLDLDTNRPPSQTKGALLASLL